MATGGAGYEMLRTRRSGHKAGTVKDTEAIIKYIQSRTPIFIETGSRLNIKTKLSDVASSSINNQLSFLLLLIFPIISISVMAEF